MAVNESRFDVRLLESRIRRGTVTAEEYEKFLASLPDDAENAENVKVQFSAAYADKNRRG